MSDYPTKKTLGLCAGKRCRVGVTPGSGDRCPECTKKEAARTAACLGCGKTFTRKSDQPGAKFCCKACWKMAIGRLRTGLKRKMTGGGPARFRAPGSRSATIHDSACRCPGCMGMRYQEPGDRLQLVARVAREMGVPVSPLAGTSSVQGPITQGEFQDRWDEINAAKREANRLKTWDR